MPRQPERDRPERDRRSSATRSRRESSYSCSRPSAPSSAASASSSLWSRRGARASQGAGPHDWGQPRPLRHRSKTEGRAARPRTARFRKQAKGPRATR